MTAPKKPDKPVRIRGGLTGALLIMLQNAHRKKPLTRADAVRRLCHQFPSFDPEAIEKFVTTNLPTRLRRVRGISIMYGRTQKKGAKRGYWAGKLPKPPPDEDQEL